MHVKRFADAQPYQAPNHFDVKSLRLQGFEPGGPAGYWVGLSHFAPGAAAGPDSSPLEKVYVVLSGNLTVRSDGREVSLEALDSCCIPGGETREVRNLGSEVATMIVVMPYPAAPQ
jgi:mannose-6-phosphate isomerase-like protein (cupin superfamily)